MNVSVGDAKAQLPGNVEPAEAGDEIVPTPENELPTSSEGGSKKQSLNGALKGKIWIADDFDELGPEWDEYVK
jgi:hypothetical protein